MGYLDIYFWIIICLLTIWRGIHYTISIHKRFKSENSNKQFKIDDNWEYFIGLINDDKFEFNEEESLLSKILEADVLAFTTKDFINGKKFIIYHFNSDNRTAVFEWDDENKCPRRCIVSSYDTEKSNLAYLLLKEKCFTKNI